MTQDIEDIIRKRTEFLTLLDRDIEKNHQIREEIKKDKKSLEETRQNINELGTQPEHTGFIPLCKRLYMPGTIVHTGEYMVGKKAHPNSYHVLKTLDQTLKHLDGRIKEQEEQHHKVNQAIPQLEERQKLLLGEIDENTLIKQDFYNDEEFGISMEVASMPTEIRSNKGVAVKVGEFYEILEYEEK